MSTQAGLGHLCALVSCIVDKGNFIAGSSMYGNRIIGINFWKYYMHDDNFVENDHDLAP